MTRKQREAVTWYGLDASKYRKVNATAETLYLEHIETGKVVALRW